MSKNKNRNSTSDNKPSRKAVQLAAYSGGGVDMETFTCIVALCNDGTVWEIDTSRNGSKWIRIPNIPQD